jgi:hypothetical protein
MQMAKSNTPMFNKLSYILEETSINALANETGIPYTSLYYYSKGQRNLPSQYENSLFKAYNRAAYGRMRDKGYDVLTASKRSRWSPEKLHILEASEMEHVELYTLFNVQKYYPDRKLTLQEAMNTSEWSVYRERIERSIKQRQEWELTHPDEEYKYPEERGW